MHHVAQRKHVASRWLASVVEEEEEALSEQHNDR